MLTRKRFWPILPTLLEQPSWRKSAAYVEVIEDFQQKALQQGSEDPACAEMLQKCEELLPGQARVKNNLLIIKLKHTGSVWKKVIKQKYPGAVSNGRVVATDK